MKWMFRTFLATAASIAVALLLSMLPRPDGERGGFWNMDLAVFSHNKQLELNNNNLVDSLASRKLHAELTKVDWQHQTLWVDLTVKSEGWTRENVYDDLYDLVILGFTEMGNVKQVMVRVLLKEPGAKTGAGLLAAMDARREDMAKLTKVSDKANLRNAATYFNSRFRMTYTKLWERAQE